jgi:DNA polymerase
LKKSGSWCYGLDPTTEVLCLAFHLPSWAKDDVALWHPAFPQLDIPEGLEGNHPDALRDLFKWVMNGGLVEAHNAWFERGLWQNIMVPRYGWSTIGHSQWRCSAAKAAAHAIPRGLDDALAAMKLRVRKDDTGHKVMQKMTKPRKPRKAEIEAWTAAHGKARMPRLYHETLEQMVALWDYCMQDVVAEVALSAALPDLSDDEQDYYLMDQTINERGFRLDKDAITTALHLLDHEAKRLNGELKMLTKGKVQRATQRDRMKLWFAKEGLHLEDTQAATLDSYLAPECQTPLSPRTKRGLEIVRALGRSSTAKYETMRHWLCLDQRAHGGLLYHGASTGRWTGVGIQPHNFVRGTIKDMSAVWDTLLTRDIEQIQIAYPNLMEVLSHALRGAIVAAPGKQLYVADFAAIEARVLLWVAGDETGLDIFRSGRDIYLDMAASIYGYACTKESRPQERQLGKVAILGLGYQMGPAKFVDAVKKMAGIDISEDLAHQTVDAYREKYWRVKQLWTDQEVAAIWAVQHPDKPSVCGKVTWQMGGKFLYCTLPSGRNLAYPYPQVKQRKTPWDEWKSALTFMGVNPLNRQWQSQQTYGGCLVENIVQGLARDLMAAAMARCEASGVYQPVLSVHDEAVCEAHPILGDVHFFERLVSEVPDWAAGLPVAAEAWTGPRYRK